MQAATVQAKHGQHYSHAALGPLGQLSQYGFVMPPLRERPVPGKVFLQAPLALTGAEVSFGLLPAGLGMPFLHRHREHEEIYLFLRGSGEVQVDDALLPVEEGSVVRVAPPAARALRNTGEEGLVYIVLQVQQNSLHVGTIDDGELLADKPAWCRLDG